MASLYRAQLGNYDQLFDSDGWDFHTQLAEKYGALCKVHGLFGVSSNLKVGFSDSLAAISKKSSTSSILLLYTILSSKINTHTKKPNHSLSTSLLYLEISRCSGPDS